MPSSTANTTSINLRPAITADDEACRDRPRPAGAPGGVDGSPSTPATTFLRPGHPAGRSGMVRIPTDRGPSHSQAPGTSTGKPATPDEPITPADGDTRSAWVTERSCSGPDSGLHLDDAVSAHHACRNPPPASGGSRIAITGDISNAGSRAGTVCGVSSDAAPSGLRQVGRS